jgi:hypothetical protein
MSKLPPYNIESAMADHRVDIHFNKKNLEDSRLPPWVVRHRGETYYTYKVEINAKSETKYKDDNPSVRGVIACKGTLKFFGLVQDNTYERIVIEAP